MMHRNFTFSYNENRDFFGLKADWMPNADPISGLGCAHDMLEHFPTQTSALEGECEAIGAMLHLRLENDWMGGRGRRRSEHWEVIAAELSACLMDAVHYELDLPKRLRSMPLAPQAEASVQGGVMDAFRMARSEVGDFAAGQAILATPGLDEALAGWVRRGYRRAVRRFAQVNTYSVSDYLFPKVEKTLDMLMQGHLEDGDKVGVSLNLQDLTIHIRINGFPANDMLGL